MCLSQATGAANCPNRSVALQAKGKGGLPDCVRHNSRPLS